VLAVLYFGLMELILIDSARELNEAQRYRARVVAAALAENAAELAARNLLTGPHLPVNEEDARGRMKAELRRSGTNFTITAEGETRGALAQKATVEVFGEIKGNQIQVNYTFHSQ